METDIIVTDDIINARLYEKALPPAFFEQTAKQQMLNANVLPIQTLDAGNCCFEALNRTVYHDSSHSRICKTRRNMCAYIENHYSVFEKDLVRSAADPVTKESLLLQHGCYKERVGKEYYGDVNTVTIFAAMECIRFLILKIHENSSECIGDDELKGERYVLVFDSRVPHWLATADRSARPETMHVPDPEPLYFSNPFCESTGFLDSFSQAADGADIRYMSKRDVLCMFRSVE